MISTFHNVQQVSSVLYLHTRKKKKICFPTILSICSVTFSSNICTPLLSLTLFCIFILIVIRTTCHIFTIYYQIQLFYALVLTQRIVQHNTYMLLPSPLPQISHAFSFCCSQPKESRIFSAIQTMWTRQWLFWGKISGLFSPGQCHWQSSKAVA